MRHAHGSPKYCGSAGRAPGGILPHLRLPGNQYVIPSLLHKYLLTHRTAPLIYSWSAANTAGDTKRKCTSATLFVGQSVGNVVGPLLYTPSEAPKYTRGLTSNLALYCVIMVLVGVTSAYLAFLNKSHSKRRVAMGKSAIIIDTSLFSAEEAESMQQAGQPAGGDGHEIAAPGEDGVQCDVGSRAFENLTDLQNEEFVFVF